MSMIRVVKDVRAYWREPGAARPLESVLLRNYAGEALSIGQDGSARILGLAMPGGKAWHIDLLPGEWEECRPATQAVLWEDGA